MLPAIRSLSLRSRWAVSALIVLAVSLPLLAPRAAAQGGSVEISPGFNLVVYNGATLPVEFALNNALPAISGVYRFDNTTKTWQRWGAGLPAGLQQLGQLQQGTAYFVNATAATTWTFPSSAGAVVTNPTPSLPLAAGTEEALDAIVTIEVLDQGTDPPAVIARFSGFVVSRTQIVSQFAAQGYLLDAGVAFRVTFATGAEAMATAGGRDAGRGIVVLLVGSTPEGVRRIDWASGTTPTVGDTVSALGAPVAACIEQDLNTALVTATVSQVENNAVWFDFPGASPPGCPTLLGGGPLVDAEGALVAIEQLGGAGPPGGIALGVDSVRVGLEGLLGN